MLLDDNFEMQGGVRNYLGKTEEVTAPKFWKSSKDSPKTELAYITEAEKGLLIDANLHGSLKDGKPNVGASGLLSYDGWGDASDGFGSSGSSSNSSSDDSSNSSSNASYSNPNYSGGNANTGTITGSQASSNSSNDDSSNSSSNTVDPGFQNALNNPYNTGDVDAEDEYLAPDIDHYKATQKAINESNDNLGDLNQSDYNDWSKEDQDTYQLEMNKLKGTEGKNYSFYAGNEGTINNTFGENWKDAAVVTPALKFSPTLRFLVAGAKTLQQNATTDYGTGYYGGTDFTGSGSGMPVDGGGWIGRIFNSDGTVNTNITESEANDIYKQAQNDLPYLVGNTQPQESMVNQYFANMGSNLGVSSAYMDTYNAAKENIANTLNLQPNNQQYGYGNTFNDNYARSMTSANPFFDELTNQGLI